MTGDIGIDGVETCEAVSHADITPVIVLLDKIGFAFAGPLAPHIDQRQIPVSQPTRERIVRDLS